MWPSAASSSSSSSPPSFKPLADFAHGLGLKFGVWTLRGASPDAVARDLPVKGSFDAFFVSRRRRRLGGGEILRPRPPPSQFYRAPGAFSESGVRFLLRGFSRPTHVHVVHGRACGCACVPGSSPPTTLGAVAFNASACPAGQELWCTCSWDKEGVGIDASQPGAQVRWLFVVGGCRCDFAVTDLSPPSLCHPPCLAGKPNCLFCVCLFVCLRSGLLRLGGGAVCRVGCGPYQVGLHVRSCRWLRHRNAARVECCGQSGALRRALNGGVVSCRWWHHVARSRRLSCRVRMMCVCSCARARACVCDGVCECCDDRCGTVNRHNRSRERSLTASQLRYARLVLSLLSLLSSLLRFVASFVRSFVRSSPVPPYGTFPLSRRRYGA